MSLLRDWRGQFSWGRFCALVALVVAVVGQWTGMEVEATKLWLAVAVGNYGVSKLTEAVALIRKVGVEAPSAPGVPPKRNATDGVEHADRGNHQGGEA